MHDLRTRAVITEIERQLDLDRARLRSHLDARHNTPHPVSVVRTFMRLFGAAAKRRQRPRRAGDGSLARER
jgi:hypothetical protein